MLTVLDHGREYSFTFEEMLKYHGPIAPGGVAHAYKVMERAFAHLCPNTPPSRHDIRIETSFGGPGARDAFEVITRAVTSERYIVDKKFAKPFVNFGYRSRYIFRLFYGEDMVTLMLREGMVREEFLALGAKKDRSADENIHLAWLKEEMTARLMSHHASAVYDIVES
ncbi:MAG: hypothetical protein HF962_03415 [Sulfurovum sp.]|nr:hypothetical protein [Sulfurovum sp.]